MPFHAIGGVPRSGSTLLCNILNQRPDTWASSTSGLPNLLAQMSQVLSNSPEITADLANIPEAAERNRETMAMAIVEWYRHRSEPVIVDKSRGWNHQLVLLRALMPDAGLVVMVRDPRDILASAERAHQASGEYQAGESHMLFERCSALMSAPSPENPNGGVIGTAIQGVQDLIDRSGMSNLRFIDTRTLVAAPEATMQKVEETFGISAHEYDFESVENTSTDLDCLYRGKWPHQGDGKVTDESRSWREVIPDRIAEATLVRWPLYCQTFGYS